MPPTLLPSLTLLIQGYHRLSAIMPLTLTFGCQGGTQLLLLLHLLLLLLLFSLLLLLMLLLLLLLLILGLLLLLNYYLLLPLLLLLPIRLAGCHHSCCFSFSYSCFSAPSRQSPAQLFGVQGSTYTNHTHTHTKVPQHNWTQIY